MLKYFFIVLALGLVSGYPQLLGTNPRHFNQRANQYFSPWQHNAMPYFQYPPNWNNYGMMMPPTNYNQNSMTNQVTGCSRDAGCSSACLGNPFYLGYNWQYPQYAQSQNINDIVEGGESTTTPQPVVQPPEFTGCQYSGCSLGNGIYGPSCGLRAGSGYSLCGATNGWPTSYCGNDWSYGPYCDTDLCTRDCQNYGQNGGFCQQDKCHCFKQTFKAIHGSGEPVASEDSVAP